MTKRWRLTQHAEAALKAIAIWTEDTFGPRQAIAYENDIINRCRAIANNTAPSQDCSILISAQSPGTLRFTRSGQHFIIYLDQGDTIIILDFLHSQSNLPAKINDLMTRSRP
ncbi:type II toxin-antitoxin system RelE/ParE family toxin [Thalassospira sp.]|uniref:type II toxin-antitoxin system RelE/ParE family toxin n=1 Tax=Thalassospira sp. TaxID=1912094 RepID=UPI0027354DBA|nr:type II toxin-antitoxin system RelE/ParE family toxin [Thalassospira sp.]MDP2697287.1 type II toxin-antitoxin system RelE/ParE family toxin [Thalassospira sp.]